VKAPRAAANGNGWTGSQSGKGHGEGCFWLNWEASAA